jgi:tryptophanyl-tRNA synthetase
VTARVPQQAIVAQAIDDDFVEACNPGAFGWEDLLVVPCTNHRSWNRLRSFCELADPESVGPEDVVKPWGGESPPRGSSVRASDGHEAPCVSGSTFGLEPGSGSDSAQGVADDVYGAQLRTDSAYDGTNRSHDVRQVAGGGRVCNSLDSGDATEQQESGQVSQAIGVAHEPMNQDDGGESTRGPRGRFWQRAQSSDRPQSGAHSGDCLSYCHASQVHPHVRHLRLQQRWIARGVSGIVRGAIEDRWSHMIPGAHARGLVVTRALTGIKPTGNVHVGNWLGMINPALALADQFQAFYFIADYHAMTTVRDAAKLRQFTLETTAAWLALGLNTDQATLFRQSDIPEVCELAWILSCQIPTGVLERGHAVKAAREGGLDVNIGTWFYPVLMAADILLYDSEIVPVGRDQKQHVEVARDLAVKMNHQYGEGTLVVPTVSIQDDVATIPGLDGKKMSKSYGNEIPLWLPPKKLRKLVMKIVTDSTPVEEPKNPDGDTVFELYKLLASAEDTEALRQRYLSGGFGHGHFKEDLFQALEALLAGPREEFQRWVAEPDSVAEVLRRGAGRAREAASATVDRVRSRTGLT